MEREGTRAGTPVSNGQVLAIAGGVSALAAGTVAVINRLREPRRPASRVGAARASARKSLERNIQAMRDEAQNVALRGRIEVNRAAHKASDAAQSARGVTGVDAKRVRSSAARATEATAARLAGAQSLASVEARDVAGSLKHQLDATWKRGREIRHELPTIKRKESQKQAEALADMASKKLKLVRENVAPALDTIRNQAPHLTDTVAGTASSRVHQVAEYAAGLADTARQRADRADLPSVTASVRPAGETVKETFSRLKDDVAPVARDAAVQTAAAAIQLWEATREQAADLNTKDLQKASGHLFSDLAERAKEATSSAAAVTHDATEELADRTEEARERAEEITRRAASATAESSKDATSTLVWAGIAGGLVYYGLLNDSQRRRVDMAARSIYNGMTELVRDIQGYDADF